jgi:antitoxin (DNA-binding transcriptional repressor) of toxin-antitoxin stability system
VDPAGRLLDTVATGGYCTDVAEIKIVGIKDLKNNLSAHLRDVRRGTRVLVSDRSAVVAELHEPTARYALPDVADPIVADWIREGTVVPPVRKKSPLPASPVRVAEGTAQRLLDQDRNEGSP